MLGGSEGKIMYHSSARFHVIILFTWIFTDTRKSKNIQKNLWNLVEKLDFSIGWINKILKGNVC